MKAPANNSKPRTLCPPGEHLARINTIADLGTQHFKPGDDGSRKLYLGFETSNLRHVFDEAKGEQPFNLQSEFAWYMTGTKKTKLRQFVEGFWGKPFPSDAAASDFDFSTMLGKPCYIIVSHQFKTDGSPKAVIAGVRPAKDAAGQVVTVPPLVNRAVCYEIGNGEDENFAKLPPFLQKKIKESDEFNGGNNPPEDEIPMHHDSQGEPVEAPASTEEEGCPF